MFFLKLLLITFLKLKRFISNNNLVDSRALFISNAGIGDTIYLLSAIQFYNQLTGIKADILIPSSSKDLLFKNEYLNKIFIINECQKIDFKTYNYIFSNRTDISILLEIIKSGFSYNFIENPNYEKLRLISRIRCLISQNYKKNYFSKFHAGLQFNYILKDIFKSEIKFLKPKVTSIKPKGFEINNYLGKNQNYGILHVAGQDEIRKLNSKLIYNISQNINYPVVLVGSKYDLIPFENINFNSNVYNGIGEFSLNEVLYLLENSTFCIAPDSSIMHLAALTKTKLISLMGNALEQTFGPYFSTNKIILSRKPNCSPCSKKVCRKFNGHSCVQDITLEEILSSF